MSNAVLTPDYICGLVDGEGCFALNYRRDKRLDRKRQPEYFYWTIKFIIVLRDDDKVLLEKVRESFDCGYVRVSMGAARYHVDKIDDLTEKILPFFSNHRLRGKKYNDFLLWAEALAILHEARQVSPPKGTRGFPKMRLDPSDTQRLYEIREEMRKYKSKGPEWKWLGTHDEVDHDGQ